MRVYGVGTLILGLGISSTLEARAQQQDDAYLADDAAKRSSSTEPRGRSLWKVHRPTEDPAWPPLTTEQLRAQVSDLEVRGGPPPATAELLLGASLPFQVLGAGLQADFYIADRVRITGLGTLGATPTWNDQFRASPFGELGVGVVLQRWVSRTDVEVELPAVGVGGVRALRAFVPRSQSIEIEAGLFSGIVSLYRCIDNCGDLNLGNRTVEDHSRAFTYGFVGVRYLYYRWAKSEAAHFRNAQRFQVTLDVVTRPLRLPAADLQDYTGATISLHEVGGRVGIRLPAIKPSQRPLCVSMDFGVGYLPAPGDVTGTFNVSFF